MRAYPLVRNVIIVNEEINGLDTVKVDFTLSYDCNPFDAEMVGTNVNTDGAGFIEFNNFIIDDVDSVSEEDEAIIFKILRKEIMQAFTVT